LKFIKNTVGVILIGLICAYGTKQMWNDVMPYMFNLKPISYFHALSLFLLCKILLIMPIVSYNTKTIIEPCICAQLNHKEIEEIKI